MKARVVRISVLSIGFGHIGGDIPPHMKKVGGGSHLFIFFAVHPKNMFFDRFSAICPPIKVFFVAREARGRKFGYIYGI